MKKRMFLPMNLQFFAEDAGLEAGNTNAEGASENGDTDEGTKTTEEAGEGTEDTSEVDKIVEKLQKRLDSKTASEKDAKTQLDEALAKIAELEKGSKKSVKEKSAEEKLAELQKGKDDEIAQLKSQINLANITQQADEVLKEAGLSVGKEMLGLLVNEDDETTYSNVKAFITFLNAQQKAWETKRNTGTTPRKTGGTNAIDPFQAIANKYKK